MASNSGGNTARSGKKDLESIDAVLSSALKRFGLENDLARYKFVLKWKEIVGDHIAARSKPESINRGVLSVRVVSSTWAQELAFQKEIILKRLQKFLGDEEVLRDVHFYVGRLDR